MWTLDSSSVHNGHSLICFRQQHWFWRECQSIFFNLSFSKEERAHRDPSEESFPSHPRGLVVSPTRVPSICSSSNTVPMQPRFSHTFLLEHGLGSRQHQVEVGVVCVNGRSWGVRWLLCVWINTQSIDKLLHVSYISFLSNDPIVVIHG